MPDASIAIQEYVNKCSDKEWCEWGAYITLARQKAVRARDLLGTSLYNWMSIFVDRQPCASACPMDIAAGMQTVMKASVNKYRVLNRSSYDDTKFCAWFGRQTAVSLSHVRRLKRDPVKYEQAARHLKEVQVDKLKKLLDKMTLQTTTPKTPTASDKDAETSGEEDEDKSQDEEGEEEEEEESEEEEEEGEEKEGDQFPTFDDEDEEEEEEDEQVGVSNSQECETLATFLISSPPVMKKPAASSSSANLDDLDEPLPAAVGGLKRKALMIRPAAVMKKPAGSVKLGCSKCRYKVTGCGRCKAKMMKKPGCKSTIGDHMDEDEDEDTFASTDPENV